MILRLTRLAILGLVIVVLATLAFYFIPKEFAAETAQSTSVPTQCKPKANPPVSEEEGNKKPPPQAPDSPIFGQRFGGAAICLLLMFVGRLFSHASNSPLLRPLVVGGDTEYRFAQIAVQVGLTLLLLFASAALAYETWAVAQGRWAVTDYVRCAYDVNTVWTIAAAGAVCLVLGNWLWHVTPSEDSSNVGQPG